MQSEQVEPAAGACLDRDLAGSLPARQPSQPQALKIGRMGALPAPGSSAQAPSKQPPNAPYTCLSTSQVV